MDLLLLRSRNQMHAQSQVRFQARNIHNERAREMAIRYKQEECVEHLDWAGKM